MSTGRMFARAAVSAVASLALITGTGSATALAAETTAAQQCATETQQASDAQQRVKTLKKKLKKAKKALKKAKQAGATKKVKKLKAKVAKLKKKLRKAKANLQVQQAQKAEWCAKADQEKADQAAALTAAMAELQKRIAEFTTMQSSGDVDALPAEVSGPMESAFGELLTHLGTLQGQLPAMDVTQLQAALAMLQGLDPAQLQAAVAGLATEIQNADDPSDLQALLDGLIGGLPAGDGGGAAEVQAAFEALVAQLQAFDPQSAGSQLPLIADAVTAALEALQNNSSMLQDIVTALTTLNGGSMPSDPADVADLLEVLTSLNGGVLPTDPADLTDLVSGLLGGTIPTDGLPGDLGDVIDGVIGGTPLPGDILDPLDPVLDPLDPILDPLPCVPLPLIPCP